MAERSEMRELLSLAGRCEAEAENWRGKPMRDFLLAMAEVFKAHAYGNAQRAQELTEAIGG